MTATPPPDLDAPWLQHYIPQFDEVLRQLELVDGFILVPVQTYSPEVARALAAWLERRGRPATVIEPRGGDAWQLLAARLLQAVPGDRGVVVIIGRESPQPGESAGLRLVNQRRDVITRHLTCPLLWCGPPAFHARTWELAPDFWSIRAIGHRLDAPALPAELPRTAPPSYHDATADILERAELERLLAAARAQHDVVNAVRVALRLARVLRLQGDLDRSVEILHIAKGDLDHAVIEPDLRDSLHALIEGSHADILQERGELDEALRIRREEELPVYERLGDVHARAITLGKIADVLKARGELDEALRIHREEGLPVYERLGDVRGRAIALGKIADVLQARGELDEALRIRREDELPVYERLGDVRAGAVTLGKIAGALAARGELDEALRIRREEQLPVLEKLGDRRGIVACHAHMALYHLARHGAGDREEALRLLEAALRAAEEMKLPEAEQIRAIMSENGL